jgi:hypothetical protein
MDIFNHQGITYYRQGDTVCNDLIRQLQQKGILMSTLVLEIAIDFQPLLEKAEQRLQEAVNQGGAYGTSVFMVPGTIYAVYTCDYAF